MCCYVFIVPLIAAWCLIRPTVACPKTWPEQSRFIEGSQWRNTASIHRSALHWMWGPRHVWQSDPTCATLLQSFLQLLSPRRRTDDPVDIYESLWTSKEWDRMTTRTTCCILLLLSFITQQKAETCWASRRAYPCPSSSCNKRSIVWRFHDLLVWKMFWKAVLASSSCFRSTWSIQARKQCAKCRAAESPSNFSLGTFGQQWHILVFIVRHVGLLCWATWIRKTPRQSTRWWGNWCKMPNAQMLLKFRPFR